jgi:hypothetical protein
MLAEVTVSLASTDRFANNTVVVPTSATLMIEADLCVLVISNGILS